MNDHPQDTHDPFNTKRPEVYELKGLQWILFYPVAWLLILYFRSWRFRISEAGREIIKQTGHPRFIVLWHGRSWMAPEMYRRFLDPSRIMALISPSKVAAYEAAFFRLYKFRVVRGSSTRRSVQAGMEIMRALKQGYDAASAPDGPSGPMYTFRHGPVPMARKVGAPILILMPNTKTGLRLNTWDRLLLPLPFARIDVQVRAVPASDPVWARANDEVAVELRRVCLEMTEDPFIVEDHE